MHALPESLRRSIRDCLESREDVLVAFLFGSRVHGRPRPDSDIDVAVLVSDRIPRRKLWNYRLDLMTDLRTACGDGVDLVVLNEAPPLLAHRVLSNGEILIERSASARVAFQVQTVNRYLDSQPMRHMYLEYLKKQVAEDRILG